MRAEAPPRSLSIPSAHSPAAGCLALVIERARRSPPWFLPPSSRRLGALFALTLGAACTSQPPEPDPPAPSPAPAPDEPDEPGPYAPGVTTLTWDDATGHRHTVEVWYPAITFDRRLPDPYPGFNVTRQGLRDADADLTGAPYPLVAFSHGLQATRLQSIFITEHLASHGYVVVAPDHVGSLILDTVRNRLVEVAMRRPSDVRAAVDRVFADAQGTGPLAGLISDDRYAMMGHSFGAFTALALSGGTLDVDAAVDWCADPPTAANGCNHINPNRFDPAAVASTDLSDPRVMATVAFSPGLWWTFGPNGSSLANLPPTLMLAGTRDFILDYDVEARPTWQASPSASLLSVEDAGHLGFSDLCQFLSFFEDCVGPEGGFTSFEDVHRISVPAVTAFLDVHWRGNTTHDDWLRPDAWSHEPLATWEDHEAL